MSTLFVSHSSRDREVAVDLAARLRSWGFADHDIFVDFDPGSGLAPGRDWERELYQELRHCKAVIILCSEASLSSPWCFAEIAQAKAAGLHLFPLRVSAYEEQLPGLPLPPPRALDVPQAPFGPRDVGDTPASLVQPPFVPPGNINVILN